MRPSASIRFGVDLTFVGASPSDRNRCIADIWLGPANGRSGRGADARRRTGCRPLRPPTWQTRKVAGDPTLTFTMLDSAPKNGRPSIWLRSATVF